MKEVEVSEHATTAASDAATAAGLATPEFDRRELTSFGQDDGHAVTVIGKMLVGFFFYSLLVMALVAGWTIWTVSRPHTPPAAAHHADDTADF